MKRKLGFAAAVGALAVVLTLALTACGGGSDSDGVASLTDTTNTTDGDQGSGNNAPNDPQEAALAYTRCMREHGVDMADPGSNGELRLQVGPGNQEKVEEAQKACEHLLENAGPRLTEEQQSTMQEGLLAFAKCMREHGIDYPDPKFGEGGRVTQQQQAGPNALNPDDPKFKKAADACEPIMDEARRKAGLPDDGGGSTQRSGGGS